MIEVNEYLQPFNAPVTQDTSGFVSAYDFNSYNDRGIVTTPFVQNNAITDVKIASLSAAKIIAGIVSVPINIGTSSGGSVILDGPNNRIVVYDATGTARIVIGNV